MGISAGCALQKWGLQKNHRNMQQPVIDFASFVRDAAVGRNTVCSWSEKRGRTLMRKGGWQMNHVAEWIRRLTLFAGGLGVLSVGFAFAVRLL
ncbi:MAG TPA: hypothetical protein VK943_11060 [Arenibaculum sp.]|nr:hypothetical protein [Arenibaculum sp.]